MKGLPRPVESPGVGGGGGVGGAEGQEECCQDGTALTDPGVCLSSSHLSISCPGQVKSPHSPSVKVLKIYGTWGILLSLGETLFSPPIH